MCISENLIESEEFWGTFPSSHSCLWQNNGVFVSEAAPQISQEPPEVLCAEREELVLPKVA